MKTIVKIALWIVVCGVLLMSALLAAAWSYASGGWCFLRSDIMCVSEVCRRWGERPLDVTAFRSAEEDESTRAAMACALLKNQDDYIGIDVSEVVLLFGHPNGYYVSESQPAYVIEFAKARGHDTWQLLFLTGLHGKVGRVVVHKNCC